VQKIVNQDPSSFEDLLSCGGFQIPFTKTEFKLPILWLSVKHGGHKKKMSQTVCMRVGDFPYKKNKLLRPGPEGLAQASPNLSQAMLQGLAWPGASG